MLPNFKGIKVLRAGNVTLKEKAFQEAVEFLRLVFPENIPSHLFTALLFCLHGALGYTGRATSLIISAYADNIHENSEADFMTEAQQCWNYCLDISVNDITELKSLLENAGLNHISISMQNALEQARAEPPR